MISGLIPLTPEPETLECIRLIDELSSNVQAASNYTRDAYQQQTVVDQITEILEYAGAAKERVKNRDTTTVISANRILALECVARCWREELMMWISLKEELYDKAWNHLVSAQNWALAAPRADSKIAEKCGMNSRLNRLDAIEKIVFPDQVFFSPGLSAGRAICTICEEDYTECPHIKQFPYNGKFCSVRIEEVEFIDHVAIVDEPANKMARAMLAGPEGNARDRMTGLPVSEINPNREVVRSIQSQEGENDETETEEN